MSNLSEGGYLNVCRVLQKELERCVQDVAARLAARKHIWRSQRVTEEHYAPSRREVTGKRDGVKASGEQLKDSDVEPLGMERRQIEVPERAVAVATNARRVGVGGRVCVNGDDLPRGG
eukprot:3709913-Pleurochrysis_carterae.AAC.1